MIIARGKFSYYIFLPHFVLQKSIIGSLPLSRHKQKKDTEDNEPSQGIGIVFIEFLYFKPITLGSSKTGTGTEHNTTDMEVITTDIEVNTTDIEVNTTDIEANTTGNETESDGETGNSRTGVDN